uniref:Origin recognition complex subunit 5 C-terminal domain-containing protein n=1 Tax=Phytophthora ramorum TaxID=164328 RepID=H3GLV9_PHYRM
MIGREVPLAELARVAGLNTDVFESPAPLVIVYGGASTGKSVGVSQALRTHSAPHTLVDCTALYSAKEFYREALAQLHNGATFAAAEDSVTIATEEEGGKPVEPTEDEDKFSSLNFLAFFKALDGFMVHHIALGDDRGRRVLYLALDHVDKLLDRGLGALLTCVCTINDQIAYLNVSEVGQLADILVEQLGMKNAGDMFRSWLVHLHGLLPPAPDGDWLEFRSAVVHLLPELQDMFLTPVTPAQASKVKKQIERTTQVHVQEFLNTRRRHLFGYHKLGRSVGDPSELISCSNLSRNCLLLVLAGYLASFNPQESDVRFLSSSGGMRRKKRAKKNTGEAGTAVTTPGSSNKKQQISQLLIGPKIFTLQRLLAIYLNLRVEADAGTPAYEEESRSSETREEIFTHLATLVRMQLFQRTTPPHVLDNIKFRCLADARFVHETARYLSFPLDSYLNRAT